MVNITHFLVSNPVENVPLSCAVVLHFGLFRAKVQPCFASHILWKWTPKVGDKDLSCYILNFVEIALTGIPIGIIYSIQRVLLK